ncbi:D-glycerate dehydrogenase [Mesorhizobium sp. 113-3-9]|uniref:2-hydroxyacid dehydrogenase n=1 Tax=Mesorhizobium sp. 113-3-9 TaxID=2744517 RepID=UPI0019268475|nr:D-glycerate dehydrogenase [Mesorhizobium sp. 113-3-9]BCG90203.1 D-glycerate dehydrogenase [Mesorhizobium sp. 113-3-9]
MTVQQDKRPVLVACALPDAALAVLNDAFDVTVVTTPERPEPEQVVAMAQGKEILLLSVTLRLTRELIERLPDSIRGVATYSVGYEHVDMDACRNRGLAVFNTPDVLTDAVAEVGLLLLLGAARRAREAATLILDGQWTGWQPTQLNGVELAGKSLGIFGMGRIGRSIAHRARAFGMAIHYSNRRRLPPELEAGAHFHADPTSLLTTSDALMLACPASEETRYFLDTKRLALMKPGAIVANVSRGNVVVDDALIAALQTGRIRAAGLDVFDGEPRFDKRYLALPNVFMLPHIGSSTIETRVRMAESLRDGLLTWAGGATPSNRIDIKGG